MMTDGLTRGELLVGVAAALATAKDGPFVSAEDLADTEALIRLEISETMQGWEPADRLSGEDGDIVTVTGEIETYRHRNPEGEFQIVTQIAARSPDGIARDPGGTERE